MGYLDLEDLAKELDALRDEDELDEDEKERLSSLVALEGQLAGDMAEYASNESTLIPDDEFEDYAQEMAESAGWVKGRDQNPVHMYIDWERWADDLKMDYFEVDFEDETYQIRSY